MPSRGLLPHPHLQSYGTQTIFFFYILAKYIFLARKREEEPAKRITIRMGAKIVKRNLFCSVADPGL